MANYTWTTDKGAKIEITVSQQHTETVYCDGDPVPVIKHELRLELLTVNGVRYTGSFAAVKGAHYIQLKLAGKLALVPIPEDIYTEIQAPTMARLAAQIEDDRDYQKHHDAVKKAMSY